MAGLAAFRQHGQGVKALAGRDELDIGFVETDQCLGVGCGQDPAELLFRDGRSGGIAGRGKDQHTRFPLQLLTEGLDRE